MTKGANHHPSASIEDFFEVSDLTTEIGEIRLVPLDLRKSSG